MAKLRGKRSAFCSEPEAWLRMRGDAMAMRPRIMMVHPIMRWVREFISAPLGVRKSPQGGAPLSPIRDGKLPGSLRRLQTANVIAQKCEERANFSSGMVKDRDTLRGRPG